MFLNAFSLSASLSLSPIFFDITYRYFLYVEIFSVFLFLLLQYSKKDWSNVGQKCIKNQRISNAHQNDKKKSGCETEIEIMSTWNKKAESL